mmetsp:Transcript_180/g.551  ORF Transcript_180/g.551 Transcript_180/m.551 type:complete len:231 (+) Transcript_180:202-894(+)
MPTLSSGPCARVDPMRPSPHPLFLWYSNTFFLTMPRAAKACFLISASFLSHPSTVVSNAPGSLVARPSSSSMGVQNRSSPPATNATCVANCSKPSKMCVAYTMVTCLVSHSCLKKAIKSPRPNTSRSTVISSKSKTAYSVSKPYASCTRRRWPSETWCIRQLGLISSTSIMRCLRFGSTFGTESSIFLAGKSPARVTPYPANATSRCQLPPMYESLPLVVRLVSKKASLP